MTNKRSINKRLDELSAPPSTVTRSAIREWLDSLPWDEADYTLNSADDEDGEQGVLAQVSENDYYRIERFVPVEWIPPWIDPDEHLPYRETETSTPEEN